jgi:hypothetical protein
MAPEQVQGRDVTPAADIYALGLVLLEALTGQPAFTGRSHEVAVARLARDPEIPDSVPASWRSLLRAMTDRDPAARPSATAVGEQLAALGTTASSTPAVMVGARSVDGDAPTEAVRIDDGTTVMPAALQPVTSPDEAAPPAGEAVAAGGSARALWLVLGVIALVVVLLATQGGGGVDLPTPPTTESVSVTSPPAPTTTTPPTTAPAAPAPAHPEKGKGHKH